MATDNTADFDRRVLEAMTGGQKLQVLLERHAGGSVPRWALERKIHPVEVNHVLAGRREYPAIRDAIAEDLGLERSAVDVLLDGAKEPATVG